MFASVSTIYATSGRKNAPVTSIDRGKRGLFLPHLQPRLAHGYLSAHTAKAANQQYEYQPARRSSRPQRALVTGAPSIWLPDTSAKRVAVKVLGAPPQSDCVPGFGSVDLERVGYSSQSKRGAALP